MKFRRALALGVALSALTAASSYAQTVGSDEPYTGPNGVYLRGEGGWSHPNDFKGNGRGSVTALDFHTSENEGYVAGGAVGYKMGQLRMELGLDFSGYDVSSVQVNNDGGLGARLGRPSLAGASTGGSGSIHTIAGMVNTYWDFRTGTPFVPYIGIGIGAARASLDSLSVAGAPLSNSSDVEFAYQPMVGVRYHLTDNVALGVEYRYFAMVTPTFKDSAGRPFQGRIESHNVLANLSYFFGAPPAPPVAATPAAAPVPVTPNPQAGLQVNPSAGPGVPPVIYAADAQPNPAAGPTQTFIVYFDLGRATMSAEGRRVADGAVAAFKNTNATHIAIAGFTDTSGPASANEALSRHRADAVRDYLIARGVPRNDMAVSWHGESDPAVATADGKVEAQNRRVEINIP
jgi:outer membrane protein OmpA-like peptidoglycan-associated protein/opacity protein-like surface antigen